MVLSYEEIRRIFRLEKNTARLVEVSPDFFEQLKVFIREERDNCVKKSINDMNMTKVNTFNNLKKMIYDIYSIREKKILNMALLTSRTGDENIEHMANEEIQLYKKLTDIMQLSRDDLLTMFEEKCEVSTPKKEIVEVIENNDVKDNVTVSTEEEVLIDDIKPKETPPEDSVSIKVLTNIPSFIGADMKEYGPFEESEVINLPKEVAKLFIARKLAELVEK